MPKKGKLIVKGNIQSVGYRAYVKQVANGLGVRGKARNLPDGTVEILFEAPDEGTYGEFYKRINRKRARSAGPFAIGVSGIILKGVTDADASSFPALFEIDYGMGLRPFEKETLERQEIGILVLSDFDSKTQENFEVMEEKYGAISKTLDELKIGLLRELSEAVRIFAGKQEH